MIDSLAHQEAQAITANPCGAPPHCAHDGLQPAVEDVNLVLFSLANVSRQLTGGPPLAAPRSFSERLPFGLRNAASVYAREVRKATKGFQPAS